MEHIVHFFADGAHITFKAPASHQPAVGGNGEMAIAAVAAIVDSILGQTFGNLEESALIEVECPQVIFQIERRLAIFILLKFLPAFVQKSTIALRLDMPCLLVRLVFACGTVTAKGKDVGLMLHDDVNQFRNLINICS